MSRIDLIDVKKITCSLAKKKTKIGTEHIIMREQLTDLKISVAQQLLKQQFLPILLQESYVKTSNEVRNKLQSIFANSVNIG